MIYHPNSNARLSAVRHNNNQYYLDNGYYYQMRNNRYYRVSAPVGMMVPSLPHGYMKIFIGAQPYYHYHGTYYRWVNNHYYVVRSEERRVGKERRAIARADEVNDVSALVR